MIGTNCKNHWSWRLISPSLTLSISCQSSLPITVPVHNQSVNSTPNYLIPILLFITPATKFPYYYLPSCSFPPQYLYLHIIICTSITPVLMLNCNYFASMTFSLPYLSTLLHLHTLYIYFLYIFSILLLTVRLCVTLCCCFCRTVLLYLGQVADVNENLFSTGLPG